MKILMYFPEDLNQPRGTRNRVINLATAVAKHHELYIAAASIASRKDAPYKFIPLRHLKRIEKLSKYFNFISLIRVVRHVKPDVIYSFTEASLPTMLIPAKIFKVPHIVEVQSIVIEDLCLRYGYYKKDGIIYKLLDWLVTWMLQKTDIQIIGCEPLMRYYKGKLRNMVLMPPSINLQLFNDRIKANEEIEKLKKKTKKIIVTYAGNFNYYQGTDLLLDTIKNMVDKKINDFLFVFVGDPSDEFKEKLYGLNLVSEVFMVGHVQNDKVAGYLRASDILIIPRLDTKVTRFAFPSKHLEYMAVGRCIVSTKTWPSESLIGHMRCGLLTDATVGDITSKLLLAKNRQLREKLGKNAAKHIQKEYAVTNDAERLEKLLRTLKRKL